LFIFGFGFSDLLAQLPECQSLSYYYEVVAKLYAEYPEKANAIVMLGLEDALR
jgi:hypothetical protein